MKQFIVICLLSLFGLKAFSQDDNVIKSGSEATFTLTKTSTGSYDCKLVEVKKFKAGAGLDGGGQLLRDKVDSNSVKLFFFRGKFGREPATLLIIKSGLNVALKYNAKIKHEGHDGFRTTDVMPLRPNLTSLEEWPDNLDEIILENFTFTDEQM